MENKIKYIVETYSFGVCNYLGEKIGIHASRVRLYFIYLSFVTMGSPVIIYLFTAFWMNLSSYLRDQNRSVLQ